MGVDGAKETSDTRRVLAVIRHPLGGIRTHILYTYPRLLEQGYAFTFVLPDIEESQDFQLDVASWPGVEVFRAPMVGRHRQRCWFLPTLRSLLRQNRFDIVHSQGIKAAVQAVLANSGIGVPHVVTSQDIIRREEFPGVGGRLKLLILSALLTRANALVTVTNDARDNHLELLPLLRLRRKSVVTILNRIDTEIFKPSDRSNGSGLRAELGLDDSVFLAGFLGRFMPQKGFLVLLDAIERLLNDGVPARFHLVAMESGDFIREYQTELCRRPCASKHVTFLPRVSNIVSVLNQLDLVLMPSLWEACGILAMEAMAVGVPVIGTSVPGLREVLQGTPSWVVPPNDPSALATAIREAICSPRREAAMAYAADARARFDVRHTASALHELFCDITRHTSRKCKRSGLQ